MSGEGEGGRRLWVREGGSRLSASASAGTPSWTSVLRDFYRSISFSNRLYAESKKRSYWEISSRMSGTVSA